MTTTRAFRWARSSQPVGGVNLAQLAAVDRQSHRRQSVARHRHHLRHRAHRRHRRELRRDAARDPGRLEHQPDRHALGRHHGQPGSASSRWRRKCRSSPASSPTPAAATTANVNPFTTVQRQEVGTILKITPQINEGGALVQLKIEHRKLRALRHYGRCEQRSSPTSAPSAPTCSSKTAASSCSAA